MLIPQFPILELILSPNYTVSLYTVFSIPQNQCYPGTPCMLKLGVAALWGDCTFILADWGSSKQICANVALFEDFSFVKKLPHKNQPPGIMLQNSSQVLQLLGH